MKYLACCLTPPESVQWALLLSYNFVQDWEAVFMDSDPDLLDSKAPIDVCFCIVCCLEDSMPILSRDYDPESKEERPCSLITGCWLGLIACSMVIIDLGNDWRSLVFTVSSLL